MRNGPFGQNLQKMSKTEKVNITIERYIFVKIVYNHFHNTLRLFDDLPNFPFTTSETMCVYSL